MLTAVAWMSSDIAKSSLGLPAAEFRHTSLLPCRVATAPCKQHVLIRGQVGETTQAAATRAVHCQGKALHMLCIQTDAKQLSSSGIPA